MQRFLPALASLLFLTTVHAGSLIADDSSAVVLVYHRFGEDTVPSTNIRLDQFDRQLAHIQNGTFNFLPLEEIVRRLKNNEPLPDRTLAFTVDDAYRSALLEAWPRLKAAGIPMTLFVSTDPVDAGTNGYMSWDDIRALQADGVTIGHHGAGHIHMQHAGLEAAEADIERASRRFQAELGMVPKLFAFPYGEYDMALKNMVVEKGFFGAFSQMSGAAGFASDPHSLPRFPVNEKYGSIGRFKLISSTKALPMRDIIPESPVITADRNPPLPGFTLTDTTISLKYMQCFPSHMDQPANLVRVGNNRYEIRFADPFPPGRNRINCTARDRDGRWFWFGRFFLVPGAALD